MKLFQRFWSLIVLTVLAALIWAPRSLWSGAQITQGTSASSSSGASGDVTNGVNYLALSTTTAQQHTSSPTFSGTLHVDAIGVTGQRVLKIFNGSSLSPAMLGFSSTVKLSTSAQIGMRYEGGANKTKFVWEMNNIEAMAMRADQGGGMLGAVGIGTDTARARLEVSSQAASNGPIMIVSTGTTKLFEVNGASLNARALPLYIAPAACDSLDTDSNGQLICGTDATGGTAAGDSFGAHLASQNVSMNGFSISTAVAVAIGTHTTAAAFLTISTSNGAPSRPLVVVATGSHRIFEVNGASVVVRASSMIVTGSMVADQFVSTGAGPAQIVATNGQFDIDTNNNGSSDFQINPSSAQINSEIILTSSNTQRVTNKTIDATVGSGNNNLIFVADEQSFTTPSFGSGTFTTYIATGNVVSSSTLGDFQFSAAISSQANFAVWKWVAPRQISLAHTVTLSSFAIVLGGDDTNGHRYVISISTTMDGRPGRETMFSTYPYGWLEGINVDISGDANGKAGYLQVAQNTALTNWETRIIPGALHYVTVSRDGDDGSNDSSTVNSFTAFFTIRYTRRNP